MPDYDQLTPYEIQWCPFCRRDNDIRYRCQLTNRILYSPETMHDECPIEFKEDEDETI